MHRIAAGARSAGRFVRRSVAALLIVAGLLLLVFGPRDVEDLPADRVVIDYWEKWSGAEGQTMQVIVDEFNRTVGAEKGIYVRFLSLAVVDQKTRIATAAGVPPDVAGIWSDRLAQLHAMDALEPLDELAAAAGIHRGQYKPVFYDDCVQEGTLVALPTTPATVALLWNRQIFAERADALRAAGCDPTRPPRTIEELDRYARALDVWETRPDGSKRLVAAGYLPMEPGWFVAHIWRWFGGSVWDPDGPPQEQIDFLDEGVVAAYEWMAEYARRIGPMSMGEFRSGLGGTLSSQNPFITGQVAMIQQGPWMAAYIDTFGPQMNRLKWEKEYEMTLPIERRRENYTWAAAPFPSARGADAGGPVTMTNLDVVVIPKGARHKAEAFEFIRYLQQQDVMERLCLAQCKNSPLAESSEAFRQRHTNPYVEVFDAMADSPNAFHAPHVPIWPELNAELVNVAQAVSAGSATPREALTAAQQRAERAWNRFLEHDRRSYTP